LVIAGADSSQRRMNIEQFPGQWQMTNIKCHMENETFVHHVICSLQKGIWLNHETTSVYQRRHRRRRIRRRHFIPQFLREQGLRYGDKTL
jgi:hypothetical protein